MAIHVLRKPHPPAPRLSPAPVAPEPVEARPGFDRDYWVANSEGYRVDDGNRRLGFVEETFADDDDAGRTVIVIRGGVLGQRLCAARAEDVAWIVPREQRIWLRTGAPLSELRDATAAPPPR